MTISLDELHPSQTDKENLHPELSALSRKISSAAKSRIMLEKLNINENPSPFYKSKILPPISSRNPSKVIHQSTKSLTRRSCGNLDFPPLLKNDFTVKQNSELGFNEEVETGEDFEIEELINTKINQGSIALVYEKPNNTLHLPPLSNNISLVTKPVKSFTSESSRYSNNICSVSNASCKALPSWFTFKYNREEEKTSCLDESLESQPELKRSSSKKLRRRKELNRVNEKFQAVKKATEFNECSSDELGDNISPSLRCVVKDTLRSLRQNRNRTSVATYDKVKLSSLARERKRRERAGAPISP